MMSVESVLCLFDFALLVLVSPTFHLTLLPDRGQLKFHILKSS